MFGFLVLVVKVFGWGEGIMFLFFNELLKNILSEGKLREEESLNYGKSNKNERSIYF